VGLDPHSDFGIESLAESQEFKRVRVDVKGRVVKRARDLQASYKWTDGVGRWLVGTESYRRQRPGRLVHEREERFLTSTGETWIARGNPQVGPKGRDCCRRHRNPAVVPDERCGTGEITVHRPGEIGVALRRVGESRRHLLSCEVEQSRR